MAAKRTMGNVIAPPRFILFFALLIPGTIAALQVVEPTVAIMAGFDLAATVFLLSCVPLFSDKPDQMRTAARDNDANRAVLLLINVILTLVILVAVAGELAGERQRTAMETTLIVATLALAWTGANMVYALHYAHLYYMGRSGGSDMGGLDFPGERPEPDYWDFVYFSFTLGIALQTSDVIITSASIRRVVALHCVAAFVFNIGVLALAVNVLAN